jgi:hypothetical protein
MIRFLTEDQWLRWCAARQLPVATAYYALETCYYGLGLRSRPGTILVTNTQLIHHSYSWRDTWWAILEPSLSIVVPLESVREARRLRLGIGVRLLQAMPDSAFRIVTLDGQAHDYVLQRRGEEFVQALRSRGVSILDEWFAA